MACYPLKLSLLHFCSFYYGCVVTCTNDHWILSGINILDITVTKGWNKVIILVNQFQCLIIIYIHFLTMGIYIYWGKSVDYRNSIPILIAFCILKQNYFLSSTLMMVVYQCSVPEWLYEWCLSFLLTKANGWKLRLCVYECLFMWKLQLNKCQIKHT